VLSKVAKWGQGESGWMLQILAQKCTNHKRNPTVSRLVPRMQF